MGLCATKIQPKYLSTEDAVAQERAALLIQARYRGNHVRKTITTKRVEGRTTWRGQEEINQYQLLEFLGKGAFGVVRRCKNKQTGRFMAVKLLNKPQLKKKRIGRFTTALESLHKEVAVWKKLNHIHVCNLFEVINDPEYDDVFLITEFVAGGTLLDDVANPDPLSQDLTRRFMAQIVNGLQYMHANNVAHRDIKPGNILVTERSMSGIVKLTDFGVSEMYKTDVPEDGSTPRTDIVYNTVGTFHFFSPEMLSGDPFHAFYADVWALGVTLYMCIAGCLPFKGKGHDALMKSISTGRYDTDVPQIRRCDSSITDLLSSMLQTNPRERIKLQDVSSHAWISGASSTSSKMKATVDLVSVSADDLDTAVTPKVGVIRAISKFKKAGGGYGKDERKNDS